MALLAQDYHAEIESLSPIEMQTSRWKTALLLPISLAFVAGGIWMLGLPDVERWIAWGCILFFGFGCLMFLVMIAKPSTLRLDRDGFTLISPFRKSTHERWSEVDNFALRKLGKSKQLLFTINREANSTAEDMAMTMTGGQGAVGGFYDMSRKELASLLQAYRDSAVRQGSV